MRRRDGGSDGRTCSTNGEVVGGTETTRKTKMELGGYCYYKS
jgi:hypothetical protein